MPVHTEASIYHLHKHKVKNHRERILNVINVIIMEFKAAWPTEKAFLNPLALMNATQSHTNVHASFSSQYLGPGYHGMWEGQREGSSEPVCPNAS